MLFSIELYPRWSFTETPHNSYHHFADDSYFKRTDHSHPCFLNLFNFVLFIHSILITFNWLILYSFDHHFWLHCMYYTKTKYTQSAAPANQQFTKMQKQKLNSHHTILEKKCINIEKANIYCSVYCTDETKTYCFFLLSVSRVQRHKYN